MNSGTLSHIRGNLRFFTAYGFKCPEYIPPTNNPDGFIVFIHYRNAGNAMSIENSHGIIYSCAWFYGNRISRHCLMRSLCLGNKYPWLFLRAFQCLDLQLLSNLGLKRSGTPGADANNQGRMHQGAASNLGYNETHRADSPHGAGPGPPPGFHPQTEHHHRAA